MVSQNILNLLSGYMTSILVSKNW